MVYAVYRLMLCAIKLIEFFSSGKADTESADWGMGNTGHKRPVTLFRKRTLNVAIDLPSTAARSDAVEGPHRIAGYASRLSCASVHLTISARTL